MKRIDVMTLGVFVVLSLAGTSIVHAQSASPKLLAVKFHADWCAACQRMGKATTHLKNRLDGRSVLFVTLDMTHKSKKRRARFLASALGLQSVWRRYHHQTGMILIIRRKTKKVVARLTSSMSVKNMAKRIASLL